MFDWEVAIAVILIIILIYEISQNWTSLGQIFAKYGVKLPGYNAGVVQQDGTLVMPIVKDISIVADHQSANTQNQTSISSVLTNVASIVLTKDTTNATMPPGETIDWRSFQIQELILFDANGVQLPSSTFASAKYCDNCGTEHISKYPASNAIDGSQGTLAWTPSSGPVQSITIALASPTTVGKILIYNRFDCCQARLAGVVMNVYDDKGVLLYSKTLTDDVIQTITAGS